MDSGKEKNNRRKAFGRLSKDKAPRQSHHSVLKFPSLETLIWQQRNKTFDSRWEKLQAGPKPVVKMERKNSIVYF